MKASELIAQLQELIEEHGDCVVDAPDYRVRRLSEFAKVDEVVAYTFDGNEAHNRDGVSFTIWY